MTSLLAALFVAPALFSNEVSEHAVIWEGFDQTWGYNHRVNRLGDFVGSPECDESGACVAQAVHTAASGTGSDQAQYRSRMTVVNAPGVGFLQGSTEFHVANRHGEGLVLHYATTQVVPATGLLLDRDHVDVVLGGFDVRSLRDPDKLSRLSMAVSGARYLPGEDKVAFDVDLTLRMDCDSVECVMASRGVDYNVSVMWTLIAGDDQVRVTAATIEDEYMWRRARPTELLADAHLSQRQVQGEPQRYDVAFTAFRGLSVSLDDDHYVQEWSTALGPTVYDGTTGVARFDSSLLFKQWNLESRRRAWSYADRGWADIEADIVLVQLAQGSAEERVVDGVIDWRANGHAPDASESQASQLISLR